MFTEFESSIKNSFPRLQQASFILACSGGVDSVVLTALCARLQMDFSLAHCNFGLRRQASDTDEQFVRLLAKKYNKKFNIKHFDTVGYVNLHKVSIQVAARELRYAWFKELMVSEKVDTLVTAHHADDDLETFIINLSRGTGINGLTGIPSNTNTICRPLLPFSRVQIEAYAKANHIEWREDATNSETKYLRNQIRRALVPELKQLHPTFLNNFKATQEHLKETSGMLADYVALLKERLFVEENDVIRVAIVDLAELSPKKAYLRALFVDYGFTAWEDIADLLDATSGKTVYSQTHRLIKDREVLLLAKIDGQEYYEYQLNDSDTELHEPLRIVVNEVVKLGDASKNVLFVDKETLKYPLTVRKPKIGDYFYPLGMQGKKKLSKYFKDVKFDKIAKEAQWLLCSGDAIVWVIGQRGDDRFKVVDATQKILKFVVKQ